MTRRLVLDASAAIHLVLRTEKAGVLVDLLEDSALIIAPDLFHAEVGNALWKYVRAEVVSIEEAIERHEEAKMLVERFIASSELVVQALTDAARYSHPVYDLLYATAAQRHGCTVVTMDESFAKLLEKMKLGVVRPG